MSLSKEQFIKNSVWTFLELTLYPILMIVATPIFIKKLGIEQYGLWMLVSTITLSMNLLNIGVGDTNIRLISKYRAQGSFELIKKVFNHNFSLSLFLCLLAVLVGMLFYRFSFISIFYKSTNYSFANTILVLACLSAGIKFVEIAIISVFKAFERFDISSKLILLSKNSVMIINLILVILNYNLITIFTLTILINILNISVQLFVLYRYERNILTIPSILFFREKLADLNYNFWYWLQSAVALLGFLADKLVVAYFTDIKTLGYYSVAALIGSHIHNFFLSFGSFIFPRVSFKLAENKEVAKIYFISRGIIALMGFTLIGFLILFGDFIFKLWLGHETFLNSVLFIKLYLVFEAGMLLIIVPFYFINGTQFIKLNSLFELVIRTTHFIAMLAGYYFYGVNGIVVGLIISTCVNIPFQYFLFHKRILPNLSSVKALWVIVPVFFLLAISLSGSWLIQLGCLVCFIATCKFIYFDPIKLHAGDFSFFNRLFYKVESK